uniref:Uncharacterized LOC110958732 n=1 Tax=Acanthochromis polyacanthus TaxID=80966 RepID=A0A3Q1E9Z9_9TELE
MKVSMDWTLVIIVLQVFFQPSLSVLFTVQAEQTVYQSKYGEKVVMGCRFSPQPANPKSDLKVTWHQITPSSFQEVIRLDNGEISASQIYQGRVRLLTEDGWAKLEMSRLRINDSGTYQCLVQTSDGDDYKSISLSVVAPYKSVTKHIEEAAEAGDVILTCQSEGFPQSSVAWQVGHQRTHNPSNTSVSETPDGLLKITTQIQVSSSERNNYTCNFTKDGSSATFHIPGSRAHSVHSTRNLLVDGEDKSAATCIQIDKENADVVINVDDMEETLGSRLKAFYSEYSAETRRHCGAFSVEELPQRLQNNDGQPVNPLDLLPEPGETVFLEGLPGNGKTTVAHILVSSWAREPSHSLDLSNLSLLLCVDCSAVKQDLYQEIKTQLSLPEETSAEELRTVLTKSGKVLLLLDGYREGNHDFDESLRMFLSDKGGCRVLITACPGHCPTLMQTAGAGRTLKFSLQGKSL